MDASNFAALDAYLDLVVALRDDDGARHLDLEVLLDRIEHDAHKRH